MPRIFDHIAPGSSLLPALQDTTLAPSSRADFCVGYFNLRGWGGLAPYVDEWESGDGPCRALIGRQGVPHEEFRDALSLLERPSYMDNETTHVLRVQLAAQLRSSSSSARRPTQTKGPFISWQASCAPGRSPSSSKGWLEALGLKRSGGGHRIGASVGRRL